MKSRIIGIAYHFPEHCETNEDLLRENPEWDMERVYSKSGIACRRIASPLETAGDLGFHAARKLLEQDLIAPKEIDYLLCCTQSPDHFLPPTSTTLQTRLGLGMHVGAFDFNLGCSGYLYGLQIAKCLIHSGDARNVLLITTDTYSKYIHRKDRTVRTLFGDGAAATLVGQCGSADGGIGEFVLGTDGRGADKLIVPSGCSRLPKNCQTGIEKVDETGCVRSDDHLYMDGPAVFSFAVTTVPRVVNEILQRCGSTVDDIDWFVYHQANRLILEKLAQLNRIPWNKMAISLHDVGNTVSASIPIVLKRYVDSDQIRPGHRLVLVGFGVGFSWGACVLTWN